jgi:hypothetical protein
LSGHRYRLAREAAANKIHGFEFVAGQCRHITVARHIRPVLRQNFLAPRIALDLPADIHPGAFEAEVEAADTAKQASDRQRHRPSRSGSSSPRRPHPAKNAPHLGAPGSGEQRPFNRLTR